ncbi:hypothetical protein EDC04DRAFT_2999521 [Pisolithus marmoratus]|nr:hypothetical protein EDC04DRAFT_2999521 [Pisolithus marmoratus]
MQLKPPSPPNYASSKVTTGSRTSRQQPPLIAHSVFSVGDGSSASGAGAVSTSESMTLTELDVLLHTNAEARAKTPRMATPRATTPRAITPRAKTPSATTPRAQTFGGQTPAPSRETEIKSSLSSLESEPGADDKIPKPSGEVGRPGRRGYNLEEQLGWGEDGFKRLKKFVNKAIKNHLDTTKCRSQQNRKALITVCDLATAEFPDLDGFANLLAHF